MTRCHILCRQLLKAVNLLFFGSIALFLLLFLIPVLGGVWFAGAAMVLILALPVSCLLAVIGLLLALWCAIREKDPKGWLFALGFLPAGILAAVIFFAMFYIGSHF